MPNLTRLSFLIAALLILAACSITEAEPDEDLDKRLHAVLAEFGGAAAFLLPSETEFAAIPQDPRNRLTPEKVELGRLLFHETALAVDPVRPEGAGTYSCASCHHAAAGFETGLRQAIGEGGRGFGQAGERRTVDPHYANSEVDVQTIRTLSPLNGAWQEVTFWSGQFGAVGPNVGTEDRWREGSTQSVNRLGYAGLESQAISALETHRMTGGPQIVAAAYPEYRELFDAAFSDRPPTSRVTEETAGLALAAYERTLVSSESPFQRWLRGDHDAISASEKRGAALFFGRAGCAQCHGGPSLGSSTFHALGMGDLDPIVGEFNLADLVHFGRGAFTGREEDNFRFKTPQLYNLADRFAFGHGATLVSIREVVEYKNRAVPENRYVSRDRISPLFRPLGLSADEVDDLTAFLERGLRDPDLKRHVPREVPSGNCLPANDLQSRRDLGCE